MNVCPTARRRPPLRPVTYLLLACLACVAGVVGAACTVDPAAPAEDGGTGPGVDARVPPDDATIDAAAVDGAVDAEGGSDGGVADGGGSDGALATVSCARPCPVGKKLADRCVSIDDPRFGCGVDTIQSPPLTANARLQCAAGSWKVTACSAGWGDCTAAVVGCETPLGTTANCGACGNACAAGQICDEGTCKAGGCPFPRVSCGGACRDLGTSPVACGECTTTCPTGGSGDGVCTAGSCDFSSPVCQAGWTACAGVPPVCVDTNDDARHCGGCSPCPPAPAGAVAVCNAGVCGTECAPGFVDCGGVCASLKGDAAHCGTCGNACGAGETCAGGDCVTAASAVIASGFSAASFRALDLAVDGAAVYVLDTPNNRITRVDKTTLAATTLVANAYVGASSAAYLRTHGGYVYWNSSLTSAIVRTPAAGGVIESIVSTTARDFVVDATHVYVVSGGVMSRAANAPGSVLAATPAPIGTVVGLEDGGPYVYAVAQSSTSAILLIRYEKATGIVTVVGNTSAPLAWGPNVGEGFALIGGPASFTTADNIVSARRSETAPYGFTHGFRREQGTEATSYGGGSDACSTFNGVKGSITRMDGANGRRRVVGAGVGSSVRRIATDATHVYWVDGAGFLGRIKK